jgi:hypothetical protein
MQGKRLRRTGILLLVGGGAGYLAVRSLALDNWIILLFYGLIPWAGFAAFVMLGLALTGIVVVLASISHPDHGRSPSQLGGRQR